MFCVFIRMITHDTFSWRNKKKYQYLLVGKKNALFGLMLKVYPFSMLQFGIVDGIM